MESGHQAGALLGAQGSPGPLPTETRTLLTQTLPARTPAGTERLYQLGGGPCRQNDLNRAPRLAVHLAQPSPNHTPSTRASQIQEQGPPLPGRQHRGPLSPFIPPSDSSCGPGRVGPRRWHLRALGDRSYPPTSTGKRA